MCKFSGLAAFPYDTLKCAIQLGGWGYSGSHQGFQLLGDGYEFSNQELTAGSSYQEYSIEGVTCTLENLVYPLANNDPWPVMTYVALAR